jgi:hypothetical protein
MVVSGGDEGRVSAARWCRGGLLRLLGVPRRRRAVHLAAAARPQRRGLFNARGELVGIGSLFVTTRCRRWQPGAAHGRQHVRAGRPAAPILPELLSAGRSKSSGGPGWASTASSTRAASGWCVSPTTARPTSPASRSATDRAHRRPGRRLARALWKQLWRGRRARAHGAARSSAAAASEKLTVHAVDREKTLRRPRACGAPGRFSRDQALTHRRVAQAQAQLARRRWLSQPARFAHEAHLHGRQRAAASARARRGGRGRPHRSAARSK